MKINISNETIVLLKEQLSKKNKKYIRLNMAGFGWGGPSFNIVLEEQIEKNDIQTNVNDLIILVDNEFESFLNDSTIYHSKGLFGNTFKVKSSNSGC